MKLKPEVLSAPELLCGEALVRWMLQHAAALRQGCADKMPPMAYPASLPQLLVLAGIDRIGLADAPAQDGKLWPGAFNWRGIDGTQVLVLGPTATEAPGAIEKPGAMLNPRSSRVKHVVDGRTGQITQNVPVWFGELPCASSSCAAHGHNAPLAAAAALLHDAEFFAALRPGGLSGYPAALLDDLWNRTLASNINTYKQVHKITSDIIASAAAAWARQIDTRPMRRLLVVFNTLSWPDSEVVAVPAPRGKPPQSLRDAQGNVISAVQRIRTPQGAALLVRPAQVPGLGHAVFDLSEHAPAYNPAEAVTASDSARGGILENRLLRVEIDGGGRITRLFDKGVGREVLRPGHPANQLLVQTGAADARAINGPATLRLVESGPLRAALELSRRLGRRSTITQRIMLQTESRRIDFQTRLDWREQGATLRAVHPVEILAAQANYETPYGHIARPTYRNGCPDAAPAEFAAQKWVDLSEPGYGVALLNNGLSSHGVVGNQLELSLVGPAQSGRGADSVTYSLYPHPGDWRSAGVIPQAWRIATPLHARLEPAHSGPVPPRAGLIQIDVPHVIIGALKRARSGNALILRLYEAWGQRGPVVLTLAHPFKKCTPVDLLERPTPLDDVMAESRTIRLYMTPFAIRTLALEMG